jgi:hypothetical protein
MANYTDNHLYGTNPESYFNNNKRINVNVDKLWQPSEASFNYVSPRLSFNRETRFKLHSIYWPADN